MRGGTTLAGDENNNVNSIQFIVLVALQDMRKAQNKYVTNNAIMERKRTFRTLLLQTEGSRCNHIYSLVTHSVPDAL